VPARLADRVADLDLREAHSFAISPADTDSRRTGEPPAKTLIAVTFRSPLRPNRTRSRVRRVPENMRT